MAKAKKQNLETLTKHLAQVKQLLPVYLIISADPLLRQRAVDAIIAKRFGTHIDDMALERFDAKTHGVRKALDGVQMPAFFGGNKLVILKNIGKLKSADAEQIRDYAAKPSQKSTLLLVDQEIDKRKKIWTQIIKSSFTLTLGELRDSEIPAWIRHEASMKKIKLTSNAVDILAQLVGNQLGLLAQHLEKLQLAVGEQEIDENTVMQHVVDTKQRNSFELADAISSRDLYQQMACLGPLLEQKEPALRILAMITRQIRILLGVKVGMHKRMNDDEISARSGASKYFLWKYKNGASKYQYQELIAFHKACYEADFLLKSSKIPDRLVLEQMLIKMAIGQNN